MADLVAARAAYGAAAARLSDAEAEHVRLFERFGYFPAAERAELDAAAERVEGARRRLDEARKALDAVESGSGLAPEPVESGAGHAPAPVGSARWMAETLREIAGATPTLDDERLGYVEVQVSRDLWLELQAWAKV